MSNTFTPETARSHIGEVFISDWVAIDQDRINRFGDVTDDPDPHHIDPEFCAKNSPWGKPIAFGFLTISMLTPLLYQVYRYPLDGDPSDGYPASYGFKNLRLVSCVPVDSRIRGKFTINEVADRKPGQLMLTLGVEVEIEGEGRPALTGDWEMLWIQEATPA